MHLFATQILVQSQGLLGRTQVGAITYEGSGIVRGIDWMQCGRDTEIQ